MQLTITGMAWESLFRRQVATGSVLLCIQPGTSEDRGAAPNGTMKQHLALEGAWELPQVLVVFLENPRGPELHSG